MKTLNNSGKCEFGRADSSCGRACVIISNNKVVILYTSSGKQSHLENNTTIKLCLSSTLIERFLS